MQISQAQLDDVIAHARDEAPNECCGYMRLSDGRVDEVFRAENARKSPYGYEFDSKTLLEANKLEWDGFGVATYHSHPRSAAEPSQTDINLARYPEWLYLIVSLAGEPEMRAWRIRDGRVEEEAVDVT
jgi:[CysO sulfur-carrier protein]-S-L-cysteine hydrolase